MLRHLRIVKFLYSAYKPVVCKRSTEIKQRINNSFQQCQTISSSAVFRQDLLENEKKEKKKIKFIPRISLIFPDKSMTITTLEEAQKIAKRRNLKLVQLQDDTKFDRHTFQLFSDKELANEVEDEIIEESSKAKEKNYKSTKLFRIDTKISDHDFGIKMNNINKLLCKRHNIKIMLTCSVEGKERMIENIKKAVNGMLTQERIKHGNVILVYFPLEENTDNSNKKQ